MSPTMNAVKLQPGTRGGNLAALIARRQDTSGLNYRQLEAFAGQAGHKLTRSDLRDFVHCKFQTLVPHKAVGLAYVLQQPVSVVVVAWLRDLGISVDTEAPELAVMNDEDLSSATKDMLVKVIDQERRLRRGDADRGDGDQVS